MRLGESPDATLVTVDVTAGCVLVFKMRVSVSRAAYGTSVHHWSQWSAGDPCTMAGSRLAATSVQREAASRTTGGARGRGGAGPRRPVSPSSCASFDPIPKGEHLSILDDLDSHTFTQSNLNPHHLISDSVIDPKGEHLFWIHKQSPPPDFGLSGNDTRKRARSGSPRPLPHQTLPRSTQRSRRAADKQTGGLHSPDPPPNPTTLYRSEIYYR